jgi:endonuclease/exonuclease/phosphatase family metal-dependent hydrolase
VVLGCSCCAASSVSIPAGLADPGPALPFDGTISVLTYNIEGAPWPFARNRNLAFRRIVARLTALRRQGRAPRIVVLQEAFSGEARAIGRQSGYRYVVDGPAAADPAPAAASELDRQFLTGAHWWVGETEGRIADSGLQILSDDPVVRVRRMAFPDFACAGFDCLASKGAVLATVSIPGAPSAIEILTTHLNSRHSSHVADERSQVAFARQAGLLGAFVNRWHDPALPLIAAGDFNAGTAPPRLAALRASVARWRGRFRNAVAAVLARTPPSPELRAIVAHGTDWQFYASGTAVPIDANRIEVPFGRDTDGGTLSDHMGYTVIYSVGAGRSALRPVTRSSVSVASSPRIPPNSRAASTRTANLPAAASRSSASNASAS